MPDAIKQTSGTQHYQTGKRLARYFDAATEASELNLLRDLYPELNSDQLLEAKERLDGYFEVALEVFLQRFSKDKIDDAPENSQNTITKVDPLP